MTKSAERAQNWIVERLEANDKIVVKAISSEAFKSSPDEFKHVLLKEHKDSIKKLSMEYVRLQKENEELRRVIEAAKEALVQADLQGNAKILKFLFTLLTVLVYIYHVCFGLCFPERTYLQSHQEYQIGIQFWSILGPF